MTSSAHPTPATSSHRQGPAAAVAHAERMLSFVAAAPSSFHAAAACVAKLVAAGAEEVSETQTWPTHTPRRVRDAPRWGSGSLDYSGRRPASLRGFRIVGSHTDSPGFRRVKPLPQTTSVGFTQIAAEVYGGPLIAS